MERLRSSPGTPTLGSYGYALQCLSEGLQRAVAEGWITKQEAETEFRRNVRSIQIAEDLKQEIKRLEDRIARMKENGAVEPLDDF